MTDKKKCSKCGIKKDINEFPKRTDTLKGVRGYCYDCRKKYTNQRYKNNYQTRRKYSMEWYSKNKEKVVKQHISNNTKYRRKAKLDCINYYSKGNNCCECCGEKFIEFLSIDHINGGGKEHRKKIKEYLPLYLKRKKFPKGYRILCHNCNLSIGFFGYCPHKENKNVN